LAILIVSLFTIHFSLFTTVSAQRDYFTAEEVELIRNAQEIDERINVLTYAIDRRFAALQIDVGGPKIAAKDSEKWGPFPTGTKAELLLDIKRILQKAIDDIDSLAERPDSMVVNPEKGEKPKSYGEVFPKAVRNLAKAATRYQPALKAELDKATEIAVKGSLVDSLEMCDQIVSAVAKLPADVKKGKN